MEWKKTTTASEITLNPLKRVLRAFQMLRDENISIGVVTSLLNINYQDLDRMYALLVDNKISVWQIQLATAMGNMEEKRELLLDPAKIPQITEFIRKKRGLQEMNLYAGDDIGYFDENEMYLRGSPGTICVWGGCQAGLKAIGIDSVGNIKGCESLYSDQFIEGNLREESLKEIWCKEGNFAYNRQFNINQLAGRCTDCDKGQICRGAAEDQAISPQVRSLRIHTAAIPGKRKALSPLALPRGESQPAG